MEKSKELIIKDAYVYKDWVHDLDVAIAVLSKAKNENKNIYIDFNGIKLYSFLDDEDSAYKKVVGMSKYEWGEAKKKWHSKYLESVKIEKQDAEAKIPEWINRGNLLIYPQREEEWIERVYARARESYHGADLENALQVMEFLSKNGSFAKAKKILNSAGHSGASYSVVIRIIADFAKNGPEFIKFIEPDIFNNPEIKEYILNRMAENSEFEKALNAQPNGN